MCQVVTDIAKDAATKYCSRGAPIVEEDGVSELPERDGEYDEERWRHDQP